MATRKCDYCEEVEGNGINVNECANCGASCCTVHSEDGENQKVLCEECWLPEPAPTEPTR